MMAEAPDNHQTPTTSQTGGNAGPVTSLSLLERVRANDPTAWERLVALYRPLIEFWCSRGGVDRSDSEDVAQEVLAGAAAGIATFRRDRPGDTFRGWLRGITRNLVRTYFRRNQDRVHAEGGSDALAQMLEIPDPLAGPAEGEDTEVGRLYQRALEQVRCEFEERTWQAFWLTVVEGRSPAALAAELGTSEMNIRQAKSRVLRRLKQEVGDLID
jgi:RNA polymerase sigma-70 factor (ECF subfamily)